uniref:glycosyltransferase family 4 protein n=1 Tax=Gilliamella sp. Nev6-6 TaxID=3120252 RepID=UPI00117B9169
FVAHEFGFYPGHGGIASYLYNICKYILLNHTGVELYVLVNCFDKKCDLLAFKNLTVISITNSKDVYEHLISIQPDFVEVSDYCALALDCLIAKNLKKQFSETVFAVHHHTASRECYEWNTSLPVKYANHFIKDCYMREKLQIMLADAQISPSSFMSAYVKKNYLIYDEVRAFNHLNVELVDNPKSIKEELSELYDLGQFSDTFNILIISRIEGRKNQRFLVEQFIKLKKKVYNCKLFIVGNTNYDEITNEESRYQIYKDIPLEFRNDILFFDFADTKQKEKFIAIGDLCVLSSTFESFSIALGETIVKGIPGMASKYTGCCDYLGATKEVATFDPFDDTDLAEKIENFYNMSKEERMNILSIQQETFSKVTSPLITVDSRLNWINEKLKSRRKNGGRNIDSWQFINNQEVVKFMGKHVILTPNNKKNKIIDNFLQYFKFNQNFTDKIIMFNENYAYINEVIDAVDYGCPILILNARNLFSEGSLLSYKDVLTAINSKKEDVIEIAINGFGNLEPNRTHLKFMLSLNEKLNFKGNINA